MEVLDEPPPSMHSIQDPVEPPDMQQLWTDHKLEENKFLQKDPLLKKEVWKLISEYRDVFSNSTPGCTNVEELQLRLKPVPSLSGRNFAISILGRKPNKTSWRPG